MTIQGERISHVIVKGEEYFEASYSRVEAYLKSASYQMDGTHNK